MESSQQKLSAAVVLLLLVMAAEMGPVQVGECLSESTTFKGWCLDSGSCNDTCLQESTAYSGGKCRGIRFQCWCITPCASATTTTLLAPEASR
ncbi:unnamed protein product [Urochloa decumbens]|uniref:Knottins-like domain-containing protein n=1 Tax=Urochloa decumbens TaxID=240449 RepID=A0ABC8YGT5_9POAL